MLFYVYRLDFIHLFGCKLLFSFDSLGSFVKILLICKLRCQLVENQYPKKVNYIQSSLAVNIHPIHEYTFYVYDCQAQELSKAKNNNVGYIVCHYSIFGFE